MIEYLERLSSQVTAESWIVRVDGHVGIAQIHDDGDREWMESTVKGSQPWVGLEHSHLVPLLSITLSDRLVLVTGDERGPNFLAMAHQLTDPLEREQWILGELAGVAEAVAMMQWRDKNFVHRRIEPANTIVTAEGHVRLRAPIFSLSTGVRRNFTGQARTARFSTAWMTPEQVTAAPSTPASDVFQLALLAYTAITQKRPFIGETDFATMTAIRDCVPPPPPRAQIRGVAELVMQNILREPDKRMKDPRAFARAVRELVGETPPAVVAKVAALRTPEVPAPHESAAIMGDRCQKQWDELSPTKDDGIRHCASCKHDVVEVRSIAALIPLLGKRCVAYKPE